MKSIQLRIAFCLSIGFSIAQANLPVIDVGSIAQSIMQYTQMVREFTKYEAELRANGIDTGRIGRVLQELDSVGKDLISGIDKFGKSGVYTEMFAAINTHCEFLNKNEQFKTKRDDLIKENFKDRDENDKAVLSCLNLLHSPMDMIEIKDEFRTKMDKALKKKDFKTYNEAKDGLKRIEKAQTYIKSQATDKKLLRWAEFYNDFENKQGEDNNPYNLKSIQNKVKIIIENTKKAQNPQEVANATNAILQQMLMLSMVQYEMSMNSNNLIIEFLSKEQKDKSEKMAKNTEEAVDTSKGEFSKLFENDTFSKFKDEVKYNEIGLPIMFE